jgi:hypothetical protein
LDLELQLHSFDKGDVSGILVREGQRCVLGVNASHHGSDAWRTSVTDEVATPVDIYGRARGNIFLGALPHIQVHPTVGFWSIVVGQKP